MAEGIQRQGEGFEVPAELIAEGLKLRVDQVPDLMRKSAITTRCERGEGEDAGRWRLSFFHAGRTFRLTVDDTGKVLGRSSFDAKAPRVAPET